MARLDGEVIRGSIVLLIIFNIYSLLNFVFQSFMARYLTIADYGVLAALGYFMYFSGIFSESVQTVVTKYAASEKDNGMLKNFIKRSFREVRKIALVLLSMYLVVMLVVSHFIEIPYGLVVINGIAVFTFLLIPLSRGVLQGRRRFSALGLNLFVEGGIKIVLGIGLVLAGWAVYGALTGVALGLIVAFILSFVSIKGVLSARERTSRGPTVLNYDPSFFVTIFCLLAFYSIDLLIALIVFPKDIAGMYSVASILSKIIFWGTQPISRALFPIMIGRSARHEKKDHAYANALALASIGILVVLILFFFFSSEIILLFSGKSLPESESILLYLGLAMSVLSYANLTLMYAFSRGTRALPWPFVGIFAGGIVLLLVFHGSLLAFSLAFLVASCAFLFASLKLLD